MPDSIYVVWNPSAENPKKRHETLESAREESRRLAQANPGQEFFVLRAVEAVMYREDPWRHRTLSRNS